MPSKPYHDVPRLPRDGNSTTSLRRLPVLDHSFSKELFPNIQPDPPLVQFWVISQCPISNFDCFGVSATVPRVVTHCWVIITLAWNISLLFDQHLGERNFIVAFVWYCRCLCTANTAACLAALPVCLSLLTAAASGSLLKALTSGSRVVLHCGIFSIF